MKVAVHSVRAPGHWRGGQFWTPTPRTIDAPADLVSALRASPLLVVTELRSAPSQVAPVGDGATGNSAPRDTKPGGAKDTVAPSATKGG